MTDRVVAALRTHLLHNYLPGAPRNEVTAALRELAVLMEKDAPLLTSRKPHRADLVSTITVLAAPKHAGGGPLIKSVNSSRVELALWSTVLPWETSRGLSFISKDLLETGRWGELTIKINNTVSVGTVQGEEEDVDDLAVISKNVAESIQKMATTNTKNGKRGSSSATPLDGSNGMLFVHRPSYPQDIPHFWSGAIQCPLDVAFLSIPTPMEELTATSGLNNARTGLNPSAAYQCLDQSTPGFGPLDDPLIYGYYLNKNSRSKRALQAGENPIDVQNVMPMRVEDVAILDPFAELEGFNINGSNGSGMVLNDGTYFDGQHMFNDGRTHRCAPRRLNAPTNRNQNTPTPIVTAVLEVRKGLFRDAVRTVQRGKSTAASSSFSSPQAGVTEDEEKVSFSVELGEELMTEMKAKEHLYRDVVETLDRRCAQLLLECEKPVGWGAKKAAQEAAEEEAAETAAAAPPSVRSANLQSWKEGSNAGSSTSELSKGNPTRLAPSFAGADGTKKSAFYTSMTRYSNASPDLPTYPPVDVEMLSLAFKLSMGVSAIPQLLGRLADDIARDSQFTEEESEKGGGLWRVKSEDIVTLVELVRNPAVALPSNLSMLILNEAARRDV